MTHGATRPDLVATFLTGISTKVYAGTTFGGLGKFGGVNADLNSLDINKDIAAAGLKPAEYLRLNMAVAPTAKPNRLGALAGDLAGFPNGRRLTDDITDEALQVTEGVLLGQSTGLGDGVNTNDKPFLSTFPYIADPNSGSSVTPGKAPVTFRQDLTSGNGRLNIYVRSITPAQKGGNVKLYTIGSTGHSVLLGTFALNAAGTAMASPNIRSASSGAVAVLYFRIDTGPNSNNSPGVGPLTVLTIH